MNYNFTDRVRKVLSMAREEAIRLQHPYVGTEHLLLGLVREGQGMAAAVVSSFSVDAEQLRERVEESVRRGKSTITLGELPYTSRAKKVLEFAMAEARELSHSYVGTEHLLLGLLREEKGIAAAVLTQLGISLEAAREETLRLLEHEPQTNRMRGGPPRTGGRGGRSNESGGIGDLIRQLLSPLDRAPQTPSRRTAPATAPGAYTFALDDSSAVSIYEQLIAQVQEAVATGKLKPGDRLPPVRRVADDLDIAPGTVARAYRELESEGVVVTEGARGTFIARAGENPLPDSRRPQTLEGLLRPVAVAAFHLGATAGELRNALDAAMKDIFGGGTEKDSAA